MNAIINLSPNALRRAANIQERIQTLQEELSELLGSEVTSPAAVTEKPKRRKVSAAGIARMRAAQKARWAKVNGKKVAGKQAPKAKGKRKMSAAAKAKISAAAKTRWAKAKAAGKKTL